MVTLTRRKGGLGSKVSSILNSEGIHNGNEKWSLVIGLSALMLGTASVPPQA